MATLGSQAQTYNNITSTAGIIATHHANKMSTGIAVADFDGNGHDDLFMTGYFNDSVLYFNDGNGQYSINSNWFVPDMSNKNCGSVAAADINNDGTQDLYVACLGNNYVLINNGSRFIDVTNESNINHPERTEALAWGDLNQDGWLDLVVGVHPLSFPPNTADPDNIDKVFFNNGDNSFTEVNINIDINQLAKATLALILTDIDFDGDLDIYMLNDRHQGNVLIMNDGPGCGGWCFSDATTTTNTARPADSMGIAVADYDLDGDWDMSYSSIDEHVFLKNTGSASLPVYDDSLVPVEPFVTQAAGWGTLMYDADNDGFEDLFVAAQYGSPAFMSNLLALNQGNGFFSDVTVASGITDASGSQAAVWLDHNLDGRLDLAYGRYNGNYQLMENTTQNTHSWVGFKLKSLTTDVNRDAIGTKVRVTLSDGREMIRELRAGESRGSNNSKLVHFGLGSASMTSVEIIWPNQEVYTFSTLAPSSYHVINYSGPDLIFRSAFE